MRRVHNIKIIIVCIMSLVLYCGSSNAQEDNFMRSYGGTLDENLTFIQQTTDNGYIMGGYSNSFSPLNDWDGWVVKLNENSTVAWQKKYGGGGDDRFYAGQQTGDGGYLFAGSTDSHAVGDFELWIVKTDSSGNVSWQKIYEATDYQEARSIQQTSDGGYIVLGGQVSATADLWIIKLTSAGGISWQKTIGGSSDDFPYMIRQTSDSGYILASTTFSFSSQFEDAYLLKLSLTGTIEWQKVYRGSQDDAIYWIEQTSDGGYIATGYTGSWGSGGEAWVLKLDSTGTITWQKTYGSSGFEYANSLAVLSDGYVVTAATDSFGSGGDVWVFKINTSGDFVWQRNYGGEFGEQPVMIKNTSDAGYSIGAITSSYGAGSSDYWALKLNSDGTMDNACTIGTTTAVVANSSASAITVVSTESSLSPEEDTPGISSVATTGSDSLQCGCTKPLFTGISSVAEPDCCLQTGVRITWPLVTSWGVGSPTTGTFEIRRYGTAGCTGTYVTVASTLSSASTTYLDTSGSANTQYYYQVRAKNNCNPVLSYAGTGSATCVAGRDNVRSNPDLTGINNTAADINCADTGVRITWPASPANWGDNNCAGSRTYDVFRGGSAIIAGIAYGTTVFTDTSGTNSTTYLYQVKYNNTCSLSSTTTGASAGDYLGTAPTGLQNNTATDPTCVDAGVQITWQQDPGGSSSNWGDSGAGSRTYEVLRNGLSVIIISYPATSYIDTGGSNETSYTYTVKYTNGCALSSTTTPGAAAADHVGYAPTGLPTPTAADVNECADTGVNITWNCNATDWGDSGSGSRTYDVLRAGTPIRTGLPYCSTGSTTYTDTTGTNNIAFSYSIRFNNGCPFSSISTGANGIDYAPSAPSGLTNNAAVDLDTCADTGVRISWSIDPSNWGDNNITAGSRTYSVLRNGVAIVTGLGYGTTNYIDTLGLNNVSYTYTVRYTNKCSLSATTSPGANAADSVGSAPSGLTNNTAVDLDACLDTGVRVTWTADPANWGDNGYNQSGRNYQVLRDGIPMASGLSYPTTAYTDTTGTNGQIYTYTVRYTNGCGLSTTTAPGAQAADDVGTSPTPANNTAEDVSPCLDTGVRVAWNADPVDWGDHGTGTRTYTVLRAGVSIATLSYPTTTFIDTTGSNGVTYLYQVRYTNGCGLSTTTPGANAADNVDTVPCGNVGNTLLVSKSGTNALIAWTAVPCADLANYRVYGASTFSAPFPSSWTVLGNPTGTSLTDPITSNYIAYKTLAVDACGNVSLY